MNKQQAQDLIKRTFEHAFEREQFVRFVKELLNGFESAPLLYRGAYIPDAYKDYIELLERVGKFKDGKNQFDILIIRLKKETSLERARTMQRNFIAWYLNGSRGRKKDAALVAYVSPDAKDWRFSLVKMEYRFGKDSMGMVTVKQEFTPAKRWSFLVGANERSHTAQSRLVNIVANDKQAPTLEELEQAFDIEPVTREFFLKYRELFLRTKEALDTVVNRDPELRADFEAKGVDTVHFAKKLLGQILFLYFLQKKGWLGVDRDNDWGSGSRNFLRELFEKKHALYSNFFNDILEPLFYEALRVDRSHVDGYYSRFNCKIPFLNGGLFDPIGDYDWVHTDINLPDSLFSNTNRTPEGDKGNGILDVFDRYNFTVREDEPLEKEVAIDPELLGKAYEKFNAIRPDNYDEYKKALRSGRKGEETKFNKKFGVYYTPREIVHYMCKQSLITYLYTQAEQEQTGIKKHEIEILIEMGEHLAEYEATALIKQEKIQQGEQKTSLYTPKIPQSIRDNAARLDKWLADIRVCDPAVGSGAFPVGMMHEIVRTRGVLSVFLNKKAENEYEFKRRCIEHSLYGVDIDPGAVEIAKLRLWLSLVVEEEDIQNIRPLPNLDYRIMQGNSLISEFIGVDFDAPDPNKDSLFKDEVDDLVEIFCQKKVDFLNESNVTKKEALKREIDDLIIKIFESKLKKSKAKFFNAIKTIEKTYALEPDETQRQAQVKAAKARIYKKFNLDLEDVEQQLKDFTSGRQIKPFFMWTLYFSEVFHDNNGFDVVIGNPPYVRADNPDIQKLRKEIMKSQSYTTLWEKWDLYVAFIEKGFQLLKAKGILEFIIPDAYMTSKYAIKSHEYFLKNSSINRVNFCSDLKIFEAEVRNIIIEFKKEIKPEHVPLRIKHSETWEGQVLLPSRAQSQMKEFTFKTDKENKVVGDLSNTLTWGEICYVSYGLRPSSDERYWKGEFIKKDLISDIRNTVHPKPYIEGKWLENYRVKTVKYLEWGTNRSPHKLVRPTFPELYIHHKIMRGRMTGAIYDETGLLCNDSIIVSVLWKDLKDVDNRSIKSSIKKDFKIKTIDMLRTDLEKNSREFDLKYLLAILNSKWAYNFLDSVRRSRLGFYPDDLKKLPIKKIDQQEQSPFIDLVDKILDLTQSQDYPNNPEKQAKVEEYKKQIDMLVYELYGLTQEEIKTVEKG